MLLAIDIGNTRIKTAVFKEDKIIKNFVFNKNALNHELNLILNSYNQIQNIIVSSVGKVEKKDFENFQNRVKIYFTTHKTKFSFHNLYATPDTVGIDRLILANGAVLSFPNINRLVIDAGTCITYDYIDDKNNYHGGAISPGIRLRYESLHRHTAKLPLLEKKAPVSEIGNSTQESIHSGVINGIVHEIDGFIEFYKGLNANFIIILTGGDTEFLANKLKNTIFVHSNFLLESLNKTFQCIQND